jgi:hypothetical protein
MMQILHTISENNTRHFEKPKFELADIFNRYWQEYHVKHNTSKLQRSVVWAIRNCRTSVLGGHIERCTNDVCSYIKNAYNSCRNRNCPKCQFSRQIKWVHDRLKELLPVPYYHVVFTLPHSLNDLALCNKEVIYDLFFKSAAFTLNAFSQDPKYLGAQLGFFGILHTWGSTLTYHIHIHFIVTGGGLAFDGSGFKRLPYKEEFIFPVKAMSRTMRGKFIKLFKAAFRENRLKFPGDLKSIEQPANFYDFCSKVGSEDWVVYSKKPFAGPEKVVDYIGRYTHRVAISNHRLVAIDNGSITFKYKDYQDEEKIKEMTLTADHFIQRFLWHIVPEGFRKIRYYGFLSPGNRQEKVDLIQKLLDVVVEKSSWASKSISEWIDRYDAVLNHRCPMCKTGIIEYLFAPT